MKYYFAPMEGLTDMVYRQVHRKHYPGLDRYYTPFVSPTQNHCFTPKEMRELSPQNNAGVPLVPQLLGKNAEDFLWAARELAALGYQEVNLNLGCPSNTVAAKGKGSGFLAFPDRLDQFLEAIFTSAPLNISVKTRLGVESADEFSRILEIYNRYPICELIIHPRTKKEMYTGGVHLDIFERALELSHSTVCYNGNLTSPEDCLRLSGHFPAVDRIMLGRGLIADPGMIVRLNGGTSDRQTLMRFHQSLCDGYLQVFGRPSAALPRMKAIWIAMLPKFQNGDAWKKQLIKAKHWSDFLTVIDQILITPYLPEYD